MGHILMCQQQIVSSDGVFRNAMKLDEILFDTKESVLGDSLLIGQVIRQSMYKKYSLLLEKWERREEESARMLKKHEDIVQNISKSVKFNSNDFKAKVNSQFLAWWMSGNYYFPLPPPEILRELKL